MFVEMTFGIVCLFSVFIYYANMKEKFYRRVLTPVTCPAAPTAPRFQGDLASLCTLLLLLYLLASRRRDDSFVSNSLLITSSQEVFASCCLFFGLFVPQRLNGFHLALGGDAETVKQTEILRFGVD